MIRNAMADDPESDGGPSGVSSRTIWIAEKSRRTARTPIHSADEGSRRGQRHDGDDRRSRGADALGRGHDRGMVGLAPGRRTEVQLDDIIRGQHPAVLDMQPY